MEGFSSRYIAGVEIFSGCGLTACLSQVVNNEGYYRNVQVQRLWKDQPRGHYQEEQLDLQKALKQGKANRLEIVIMHCIKANVTHNKDMGIHWGRFS